MTCPRCSAANIECHGQRYALYPAGFLALLGFPFAMLHQVSSPRDYRCNACGLDFRRRTTLGKVAGIVLIVIVAGFSVLFAVIAWAMITGRIS